MTVAWCNELAVLRCDTLRRSRRILYVRQVVHVSRQSGQPASRTSRDRRQPRPGSARPVQARQEQPELKSGVTRMFATAIQGLAPIVSRELSELPGIAVKDSGFDGRSDLIIFEAARGARDAVLGIGSAEDVFVEVGRTLRSEGDKPGWIAGRIWRPERVQRALSVWAEEVRPLSGSMTYRVIARVLQEHSFMRTELRRQFSDAIERDRPRWRFADPAQIEVWISEYVPGRFIAGLRLSDVRMRQHQGRATEREGALRPTVAAAMVGLAGSPDGVLLDPCCGSGTILGEALSAGWEVRGSDTDPEAIRIARQNVPGARIEAGDARKLEIADGSVAACVSNLPFGRQFTVEGDMSSWLRSVLGEMARVTQPGGKLVLLSPEIARPVVPAQLRSRDRFHIRLLGTRTTIWAYDRTG